MNLLSKLGDYREIIDSRVEEALRAYGASNLSPAERKALAKCKPIKRRS